MVENVKMHSDLKLHKPIFLLELILATGKGYFAASDESYSELEVKVGNVLS